jgi:hypothetical protein
MGLPGAGKTDWASGLQSNAYARKNRISVIDFDSFTVRKVPLERIKSHLSEYLRNPYNSQVIVDGLFLTKQDVRRFLSEMNASDLSYIKELRLEWWKPDVEVCLHNDKGRREKSAATTIKNATLEKIDKEFITSLESEFPSLKEKVSVKEHYSKMKPHWKIFADENNLYYDDKGIVKGESWCLGGSWGDCWGNHGTVAGETPPESFREFDELLEKVAPNISFLQYKTIYSKVVRTDEYGDGDYYGGSTSHAYRYFRVEDLYDALREKGLID